MSKKTNAIQTSCIRIGPKLADAGIDVGPIAADAAPNYSSWLTETLKSHLELNMSQKATSNSSLYCYQFYGHRKTFRNFKDIPMEPEG